MLFSTPTKMERSVKISKQNKKTMIKILKKIIALVILFCFSSIFSQYHSSIKGKVASADGRKIYYSYRNVEVGVTDSVTVNEESFSFDIHLKYPTGISIYRDKNSYNENNSYYFFVDNGINRIILDYNDFSKSIVEENSNQKDFIKFKEYTHDIESLMKANTKRVNNLKLKLKNISDSKQKSLLLRESDSLSYLLYDKQMNANISFVDKEPDSYVSLDRLYFILGFKDGRAKYKILRPIFDKMNANVMNNELGAFLKNKLKNIEESSIDTNAKNFETLDYNNQIFSLDDLKGKNIVLLDFWASWCVPCLQELPSLRNINKTYSEKGLKIVSVSQDQKADAWQKMVKKEQMDKWINILLHDHNRKIVLDKFGVQAIPVKVLIDKNGKIIGKWTGYSEEQSVEMEKLIMSTLQ